MAREQEIPTPKLLLGVGISLIAYLFFVTASFLVVKLGNGFPIIQLLFIQNCICWIFITPLALRKGFDNIKTQYLSDHLIRDFFGVGSYYLYFFSIQALNLTDATILNYTAPFFVPIIWWIWTQEKVSRHAWWSIIVGFLGVAVILNPTRQIFQIGFLLGLFAGIASSIALCALRILNLNKEPLSRTLFYYFTFSTLITFPFAWVYWTPPTAIEWMQSIFIGLTTAIAQILLTIAYRHGTASYLSPLSYVSVIYAGLISWLFLNTPLTLRSLLGIILIIVGGTLTYILKEKVLSIKKTFEAPDSKDRPPF